MPSSSDTLITRMVLEEQQFIAGAHRASRAAKDLAGDSTSLTRAMGVGGLKSLLMAPELAVPMMAVGLTATVAAAAALSGALVGLAPLIAAVSTGLMQLAAIGIATPFLHAAADMEKLHIALRTVTGSAENASAVFAHLKEAARGAGLNLSQSMQGFVKLFASGFGATDAIAALKEFGNAVAAEGGGPEQLGGIMLALSQMMSKGKVQAEELMQIAERLAAVRMAMQNAFGTADTEQIQRMGITPTEFIQGLTKELSKLGRAAGGIQTAFDNLGDTFKQVMAALGSGAAVVFLPILEKVEKLLGNLVSSGVLEKIGNDMAKVFGADEGGLERFLAIFIVGLKHLPGIIEAIKNAVVAGFEWIVKTIENTMRFITDLITGIKQTFYTIAISFVDVVNTIVEAINLLNPFGDVFDKISGASLIEGVMNADSSGVSPALDVYNLSKNEAAKLTKAWFDEANELSKSLGDPNSALPALNPSLDRDRLGVSMSESGNSPLGAIASNTAQIAKNTAPMLDYKRHLLGGNNLAAYATSGVSINRQRVGGYSGGGAQKKLTEAIKEMIAEARGISFGSWSES